MFSSSNNINPFPNLPSSSTFQVPFVDGEAAAAAGYFPFHHHHDPLLAGYLVPVGPNYNPGAAIPHHGLMGELSCEGRRDQEHHGGGDGKKAARKDRHSKISTSQGLRDRRVRLSIGISREFFDLQDMLGYDTASKTLEWLLGKSRKDIEELEEQIKNNQTKNSSSSSFELNEEEEEPNNPSEKKVKKSPKDVFAKESRAKARERARMRTREKLCTSSSTSSPTKSCPLPDHCHHHHHNQQYGFTQLASHNVNNMASFLAVHEKPSSSSHRPFTLHHHQQHQHLREDHVSEESILIQRKFMRPAPETTRGFVEWDISNAIRRSTISGSTNLSTELQMYGNP